MRIGFYCLVFSFCVVANAEHGDLFTKPNGGAGPNLFAGISDEPLTAKEVLAGGWTMDVNGACDAKRGCPYKNAVGSTRYLPLSEKKKLEAKEGKTKTEPVGLVELKDQKDYDAAFNENGEKEALLFLYSAEDCGPCKAVKAMLTEKQKGIKNVAFFTATRPTYAKFEGHELHEKFQKYIGNRVPVAMIYTKDENGKWVGEKVPSEKIAEALKKFEPPVALKK